MARPQLLLLLVALLLTVVSFASAEAPAPSGSDDALPSIVDPVAHSPVTDYVDLDDDADDSDDEDVAPAGSPLGTTMRPPEKTDSPSSKGTSVVAGAGTASMAVVAVAAATLGSCLVF